MKRENDAKVRREGLARGSGDFGVGVSGIGLDGIGSIHDLGGFPQWIKT